MYGSVDEYLMPLCPLRFDTHKERYLAIDSYAERLNEFQQVFTDPEQWTAKGHVVVVVGDRGFGKTSLIQQYALWLRDKPQNHCEVAVVDLSDESWRQDEPRDERLARARNWIVDSLSTVLSEPDVTRIKTNTDMEASFRDLGRVLSTRRDGDGKALPPIVPVVLLPGNPRLVAAEIDRYYSVARPGMFFFGELLERGDKERFESMTPGFRRSSVDLHVFAMDILKSGDAKLLIEWIRNHTGGWPDMPDSIVKEVIDDYMVKYKLGIAELAKLTWGTLHVAAAAGADVVTIEHINRYFAQNLYVSQLD